MKKIYRKAINNIKRDSWLSLTAVFVMTITFFTTSIFVTAAIGSNSVLKFLESRAQVTAFFFDDVDETQILNLRENLLKRGDTVEVNYLSKEDALNIYLGQHEDEPILLESITANIFPASLDIKTKSLDDLPAVAAELEKQEGVEEVVFYRDVVNNFKNWSRTARLIGITLIFMLSIISISIVLVTIGMAIHTKGGEIEIMKLVGASDWYVRWPFLLQGAAYGIVAGIISTLLLYILLPITLPKILLVFKGIPLPKINVLYLLGLTLLEIVFGAILGAVGSMLAMRRYLRY